MTKIPKLVPWVLIFNVVIYFLMTTYWHRYLDSWSESYQHQNFSSYNKNIFSFVYFIALFTIIGLPLLYFIYFNVLKQNGVYLAAFIWFCWAHFDASPTLFSDCDKLNQIPILLFDSIYAGILWVLISLWLFRRYHESISKSLIKVLMLGSINVLVMLVFFYNWFIYNRQHTENNWLVAFGDKLGWNKLIKYITVWKSQSKQNSLL